MTSTQRARKRRKRLRSEGLVRRDVWILPSKTDALKDVEQYFRQDHTKVWYYTGSPGMSIESPNREEKE